MEKFGGENFENNLEQAKEPKMSQEIFERLVGAQIAEIKDFYGGSAEDWLDNFKEKLGKIETLINSEEAAEIFNKSVLESASLGARTTMENLNGLDPDKLSKEVKETLLKSLNNLFN